MSREYQHACERAELFGQPKPSEEEWLENEKLCQQNVNEIEEEENAVAEELDQADENSKRIGGGLDELNSILSSTQRKIDRFKAVCGSLGVMLKIRRGSRSSTPKSTPKHVANEDNTEALSKQNDEDMENITVNQSEIVIDNEQAGSLSNKKIDINEKMGSHLNKLDSLITKAENAQYSMQHQSKQMKKFLK